MSTTTTSRSLPINRSAGWRRALCTTPLLLAVVACGGETGTGTGGTGTGGHPDLTSTSGADGAATLLPDSRRVLAPDTRAVAPPAPDSGQQVTPPAGCPAPADIVGSYAGTFEGMLTAIIKVPLAGSLTFTLVASGSDFTIQDGKVNGNLNGTPYALPMQGTVKCGKLEGAGTGDIAGWSLSGNYLASWAQGGFPAGTWSGTDAKQIGKAIGTWKVARK